MENWINCFLIALGLFELPSGAKGELGSDQRCLRYGGHYYRGIPCCNGNFLNLRQGLYVFDKQYQTCLIQVSKSPDNKDDHLQTIVWKAYICVLRSRCAFPGGELNFQAYVNHLTSNYEDETKGEVRQANSECPEADDESEDWRKVMKFAECFFRNEKTVCHNPSEEYKENLRKQSAAASVNTNQMYKVTCTPLEGSVTPSDDCCQKTPIPIPLKSLLLDGLLNPELMYSNFSVSTVLRCSNSFKSRQRTLRTENTGQINRCINACLFSPMIYNGPSGLVLNSTGMQLDYFAKFLLPDGFSEKLTGVFQKYRTKSTFRSIEVGKTMTLDQFVDEFNGTYDELTKIDFYCVYYEWLTVLMEKIFREYCTDSSVSSMQFGIIEKNP